MRRAIVAAFMFLAVACGQQTPWNEKEITFNSGEKGTIYFEEQDIGDEKVLVIDYRSDKMPKRESEIDKLAEEIWLAAKNDADKRGFENALIKVRVPAPSPEGGSSNQFNGLLFEAEKIENGTWKLKKVN